MLSVIGRWIPEQERARFVSFTYLGGALGSCIAFPICGFLIEWVGWESVFYIIGSVTFLWAGIWFYFVTDDPVDHPSISNEEKEYILATRGGDCKTEKEGKHQVHFSFSKVPSHSGK